MSLTVGAFETVVLRGFVQTRLSCFADVLGLMVASIWLGRRRLQRKNSREQQRDNTDKAKPVNAVFRRDILRPHDALRGHHAAAGCAVRLSVTRRAAVRVLDLN